MLSLLHFGQWHSVADFGQQACGGHQKVFHIMNAVMFQKHSVFDLLALAHLAQSPKSLFFGCTFMKQHVFEILKAI